ncbi:hypothetical protein J1605_009977 [Eschrichtius robustus]|uniref:Uncharacterized protein n=1 Tax=Eschrichtius robustus TaxID=9764 RepID=A0AB34GRG5_ESCRO|nr:hypothetical protein J1605_009977 [Eschrichtius robustus]
MDGPAIITQVTNPKEDEGRALGASEKGLAFDFDRVRFPSMCYYSCASRRESTALVRRGVVESKEIFVKASAFLLLPTWFQEQELPQLSLFL